MALEKECDLTLQIIYNGFATIEQFNNYGVAINYISAELLNNKIDIALANADTLTTILCILETDKHIVRSVYQDPQVALYKPTPKGIAFLANSSYFGKMKAAEAQMVMNQTNLEVNSNLLLANRLIAFGTSVAALYYIYNLFDFFEKHSLRVRYLEYFVTGVIVGMLPLVLKPILSKKKGNNKRQ